MCIVSSLSSLILAQSVVTRRVRDAREAENRRRANSDLKKRWRKTGLRWRMGYTNRERMKRG